MLTEEMETNRMTNPSRRVGVDGGVRAREFKKSREKRIVIERMRKE